MSSETHTIADIVDLDRHPIDDLESEGGRKTLAACRASMASRGACRLEGFLRPEALDAMVNESKRLFPQAFRHDEQFRVYVSEQMPEGLPAEDPRHATARSAQACIAWDLFSAGSMRCSMGRAKAAVFPVPVWADPMTSLPAITSGMAWD